LENIGLLYCIFRIFVEIPANFDGPQSPKETPKNPYKIRNNSAKSSRISPSKQKTHHKHQNPDGNPINFPPNYAIQRFFFGTL
jgi:hypothetical protein